MSDISSKSAQRSAFSVRDICYSGLFAAVIAIMAQISIPMPGGVPMTMQTFAITLAAVVLGAKLSTVSSVIYLLLGAVGVPVLANFSGGFDKFIAPAIRTSIPKEIKSGASTSHSHSEPIPSNGFPFSTNPTVPSSSTASIPPSLQAASAASSKPSPSPTT